MVATLAAGFATAFPLTITVSGTGSGQLGSRLFTSTPFTFTLTTDTSAVVKPPCCNTRDTPSGTPTTFLITGVGSGTLTDNQAVFVDPSGTIGLAHFNDGDLIDLNSTALNGYTLAASLGPISGTPSFVGACPGIDCTSFSTSAGSLSFNNVSSVTFTIAVASAAAPTITSVVDSAAQGAKLTPGMPVQVNGTGLGTSANDTAAVTVGGKPAPVLQYLGPAALLVQIPTDVPTGTANVVATYKGASSALFPITLTALAPGIVPPAGGVLSSFTDAAGHYITATNPAVPNTPITLTAIGLGATTPPLSTNTKVTAPAPTNLPVQVMVGGKLVMPDYAGLAVGTIGGYYQVTFKVPLDVPPGNQPVSISVGGLSSNTVMLAVGTPVPLISGILNGANFKARGAAPNSFVSIFGSSFGTQDTASNIFPATDFHGVSVLFNGVPAPLYYVFGSLGQINLVLSTLR